jgi:hypothetical protein
MKKYILTAAVLLGSSSAAVPLRRMRLPPWPCHAATSCSLAVMRP